SSSKPLVETGFAGDRTGTDDQRPFAGITLMPTSPSSKATRAAQMCHFPRNRITTAPDNGVQQSLRDITLPEMTPAPVLLKSMINVIEGDIKGVATAQAQLVEF